MVGVGILVIVRGLKKVNLHMKHSFHENLSLFAPSREAETINVAANINLEIKIWLQSA